MPSTAPFGAKAPSDRRRLCAKERKCKENGAFCPASAATGNDKLQVDYKQRCRTRTLLVSIPAYPLGDLQMSDTLAARPGLTPAWRIALWGTFAVLLAIPALAMPFTGEVNWGPDDFVVAAALLALTGIGLELAARASLSRIGKLLAAAAIVFALLVIWAELAVGLFD
jgi:hypothetical protein